MAVLYADKLLASVWRVMSEVDLFVTSNTKMLKNSAFVGNTGLLTTRWT